MMNTVVLEVRSLEEALDKSIEVIESRNPESESHISFATPELLWKLLTAKRREIRFSERLWGRAAKR